MRSAVLVLALLIASPSAALDPADIPPDLRPWTEWVLRGHERELCPRLPGDGAPACAWPGPLQLDLTAAGGRFEQSWSLLADGAVPLPGDPSRWPLDVRAGGAEAAVVALDGRPVVHLTRGTHAISGRFEWSALPESLAVPPSTGLVRLTLDGKPVAQPARDAAALVLGAAPRPAADEDALSLAVHRLVTDDVPLTIRTRLLLEVSGAPREVLLGPALPAGAIVVSLSSPLPARLEPDGRLRVQLRAGTWIVEIASRQPGPVAELTAPAGEDWSEDEVWAFAAQPHLRLVSVEGVPSLDPAQTAIPDEWRQFPTYRVARGETVRFVEKRRGDADPPADALTLQRNLWLDFDGHGLTSQDVLQGQLRRSWRLEMQPPYVLGHAAIAGEDALLTRRDPSAPAGLEIRQGQVQLVAESRVEGRPPSLPAVGWSTDVDALGATLNLPPGWRLLHASGIDRAEGSWIDRWTLLDLFLALIVAAAALRLWGLPGGALALVTLVVTIPEQGAPRWSWLLVLALAGIERLLAPGSRVRTGFMAARLAVVLLITLVTVPFLVRMARQALHPQLEASVQQPGGAPMPVAYESAAIDVQVADNAGSPSAANVWGLKKGMQVRIHDPHEIVQTGPGVPEWTWRSHGLSWSGPVARDQPMRLWLQPPFVTRLLSALTIALLLALLARAITPPDRRVRSVLPRRKRAPDGTAAALVAIALLAAPAARAEIPPPEMLDELRQALLEQPPCAGGCVSVARLRVEIAGSDLRLRLRVLAAADDSLALPGGGGGWTPDRALLDGRPAAGVLRDASGSLRLLVPRGAHDVELAGPLAGRETIALTLPHHPGRTEVVAPGWSVAGLRDGVAGDSLQLTRAATESPSPAAGGQLAPDAPAPFVRVTRTITLGLTWQVETTVEALGPTQRPIVLAVPLLPGESVTTGGVTAERGRVLVNVAPGAPAFAWRSTLPVTDALELRAADTADWSEEWRLAASPRWHAEWDGIPPVQAASGGAERVPAWRPWPGEAVTLRISRPEPVPGPGLTIQSSQLTHSPGLRVADHELAVRLIASQGGEHAITLPEGATGTWLALDELPQPVRLEGRVLRVPVLPGDHRVRVTWRDEHVMRFLHGTPEVDLGLPSVNPATIVQVPEHRWVLWTRGPVLGPAVLFWPLLVVLVLLGVGLSRLRGIPLKLHDWVLLLVGLSQVPVPAGAVVVTWLLLLLWRRERAPAAPPALFDVAQILVVAGALASVGVLFAAINQGLLGHPDMQVAGNGSSGSVLQWMADRAPGPLPRAHVVSAPLMLYRVAMLLWALWLAAALVRWMRWAWDCFTTGGAWRSPPRRERRRAAAPAPAPVPAPPETT